MIDRRRALLGVSKGGLPSDYQAVEYISTGTASEKQVWINVAPVFDPETDDFEIDFQQESAGYRVPVCGAGKNGYDNGVSIFGAGYDTLYFVLFSKYKRLLVGTGSQQQDYLRRRVVKFQAKKVYQDGEMLRDYADVSTTTVYNFIILDTNYRGNQTGDIWAYETPRHKLYAFKLWQSGTLVHDMIPCVRKSDNTPGMYDLTGSISAKSGTPFYPNEGPGILLAGPAI